MKGRMLWSSEPCWLGQNTDMKLSCDRRCVLCPHIPHHEKKKVNDRCDKHFHRGIYEVETNEGGGI